MAFQSILGPKECQNFDIDFKNIAKSDNNRHFSLSHLKRTLANGDIVDRDWVLYSPSTNSIFCFVCRLFGDAKAHEAYKTIGFSDWQNTQRSFKSHENTKQHLLSDLTYRTRVNNSRVSTIEANFMTQAQQEMDYWRNILKRIVAVIKFLGSRGLPFRGAEQKCGSIRNGNFLGILDLLSEFDPLIASHIEKYGNKGKGIMSLPSFSYGYVNQLTISHGGSKFLSGRASYLSDTICDEFIDLIGVKVLNVILTELRDAKYFSISVGQAWSIILKS